MNGLPIVRFNGGYINLGSNLQIGTDPGQCIFTVLKFNETGSDVAIIGRNNEAVGRWALDRYQGTLRYYIQTPSGFAGADYTNNNNVSSQIINVSWDRAITSMYINAEVKYSSPFSSSDNIVNSSPVGIGAFIERPSGGPIWYMSADVAEVLYYNRGLTPFDRQKVEGYLAWKWGLNANLPALHPFKLAAPINTSVFSPSSFSGLQLWLDAADATTITLTGSNVTGWADKSGANTTMNTFAGNPITVSSNALNSKSVLTFSQSYIFGKPSTVYTGDSMTAFMIGRMNNSAQYTTVLTMGRSNIDAATNSNSAGMFVLDYPSTRFDTARNNVYNRYNFDSNAYFLASAIQIPATSYMGINGGSFSNATTGTSANFNISTIVVGNNTIPDNLNVLSGNIGEMLVYFRQLSVEDCQTVEGYLAWKWGLQGSLPTAHPYKSQNPASLVSPTPYFATNFNNGNDANLINYASSNLSTNTVTSTGYSYRIQSNTMNSQTYMNNTNTVSYCASIYCTETNGSYMGVLFSRQADNNNACGIHLIGSNIGYHWITDYNFGIVVPLNTWMHVVVTISPTDAKIYINGTLSNTRTNAHSSVNLSSFYVGADPYVFSDRSFRGLIDNVAVYNTTLDAATISSIYARTLLV
jgi:hypothetical protein